MTRMMMMDYYCYPSNFIRLLFLVVGVWVTAVHVPQMNHLQLLASFLPKELLLTSSTIMMGGNNNNANYNGNRSMDIQDPRDHYSSYLQQWNVIPNKASNSDALPPQPEQQLKPQQQDDDLWKTRLPVPTHVVPEDQQCFAIENVCMHGRHWFCKPTNMSSAKHPPNVLFQYTMGSNAPLHRRNYPREINITRTAANSTSTDNQCHELPIRNHLVLASSYNHMLGEFYTRCLAGFYQTISTWFPTMESQLAFLQQTQLYLQLTDGVSLLDSHHLFTSAFRPTTPLLDVRTLLDDNTGGCKCMERLIFCGYTTTATSRNEEDGAIDTVTVTPASSVVPLNQLVVVRETRNFLRQRVIHDNPFLQQEIKDYRQSLWDSLPNVDHKDQQQHVNEQDLTIVGMAQRSGRRRWSNLDQQLRLPFVSNMAYDRKVLFVQVNVEGNDWNPYNQVVRHGALDALVGIHGAQMTEAIWMKPGSLVVELLPYLPHYVHYGNWTRTVRGPTPLGVMFHTSDLVHIGYPITIEETPACDSNSTNVPCWTHSHWEYRDFAVGVQRVWDMVDTFLVHQPTSCQEYHTKSSPDTTGYVVYNAPCLEEGQQGNATPHHFYWKENLK